MEETKNNELSFDILAFVKIIWKEKIIFLSIILLFISLGLWYAFSVQDQYISEGKILPELQSKGMKLGNLAGLANLAGVDISSIDASEAIRPDLYPDVLKSTPFFLSLFNEKIVTKNNASIRFEQFYHESIEKGAKIEKKNIEKPQIKENGFLVLNRISENRIEDLKDRILVNIDKKSGIITISVKMPDPVVAANVARFSMVYLTDYVTRYRIDKVKKDLEFLEERVNIARGKFYSNQTKKAEYFDQFQLPTIRLQSADIQRERIESEYRLASTFYNELLKKYEEAKIKLQQETPVFKVLDPPVVPTKKSEPKRLFILIASFIFGALISSISVLLIKQNYKRIIRS